MNRDTALQISVEAATRVKKLIAGIRWARHPLDHWRPDILASMTILFDAICIFPVSLPREEHADFCSPLVKARKHLEESVRTTRINKKHVNHALDILFGVLSSSRQAIATT